MADNNHKHFYVQKISCNGMMESPTELMKNIME